MNDDTFDSVPEVNSMFNEPPETPGIPSSQLDESLFGDAAAPSKGSSSNASPWPALKPGVSIFEAALSSERQRLQEETKKGGNIPAYARELAASLGHRLQEEEDDDDPEEETEDDTFNIDMGGDDSFEGGGDDSSFDFSDSDSDDDDFSDSEEEDEEDEFYDATDDEQTQKWRDEQDVDSEMTRLLGKDSPYVQGATKGRDGYLATSSTYSNATSTSGFVDEDLISADRFSSGGFVEYFDDGFVYVNGVGDSIAVVQLEAEEESGDGDSPGAVLMFKPRDSEEDILMDLSIEELGALAEALNSFKGIDKTLGY